MERFGVTSMVSPLRRVLLRRPTTSGDFAAANWRQPDPVLLGRQHEQLCSLLAGLGCEVEVAAAAPDMVDATYVRDAGMVTGYGAVLFQMAKPVAGGRAAAARGGVRGGRRSGRRKADRRGAGRRR